MKKSLFTFVFVSIFFATILPLSAQNVGIGVSTPLEKLHIGGTFRVDDLASPIAPNALSRFVYVDANGKAYSMPTGAAGTVLGLNGIGAPSWLTLGASNLLVDNGLYFNIGAGKSRLGGNLVENTTIIQGNFNLLYRLNGTGVFEARSGATLGAGLYVNPLNQVGIGTATPRGVFDVFPNADIYLVNSPIVGTTQSVYLPGHIYLAPFNGSNVSYLQARRSDNSGTTALRIRTFNAGALTEAMHIEGNGNVGVGTTSPNTKIEVDGALALRSSGSIIPINSGTQAAPQLITVGNRSYIRIGSNATNPLARVFSLSDGLQEGQILTIEYANNDVNLAAIFDVSISANSNADLNSRTVIFGSSNAYTHVGRFVWNGTDWIQEGIGSSGKAVFVHTNGAQTWTVPLGVYSIDVKLWGAGGGANTAPTNESSGGGGGFVKGSLSVTPGQVLTIIVGSGGGDGNGTYGGGGQPSFGLGGSSGGGRSAIRSGTIELVTAGGGGGAADDDNCGNNNICGVSVCRNAYGGGGGGLVGGSGGGGDGGCVADRGNGGSQVAGGVANTTGNGGQGGSGSQFQGGAGGNGSGCNTAYGGGGGGGGWFGGSGGSSSCGSGGDDSAGGGGGGSSYVALLTGTVVNLQGATNQSAWYAAPGNTTDIDYITPPGAATGVGYGAAPNQISGNGLVVIIW